MSVEDFDVVRGGDLGSEKSVNVGFSSDDDSIICSEPFSLSEITSLLSSFLCVFTRFFI